MSEIKTDSGKNTNSKYGLKTRILAAFLVIIFIGGAALGYAIQIKEVGLQYVGTVLEYASKVTLDNTSYLTQSTLERAWKVLRSAIGKPRTYEEFDTYASLAIAKGDFESAAYYLQGCIDTYEGASDAELADLYLREGSLYYLIENSETALTNLNKAIELNSELSDAYLLRAQIRNDQGDVTATLTDLEQYEQYAGTNVVIQAAMAGLYELNEEYEKAVLCYTASIDSGKYDISALASIARCQILLGNSADGQKYLERYFDEGGEDPTGDYHALLGMCRMEAGEYSKALKVFRTAEKLDYANMTDLYYQMVVCAYGAGEYQNVLEFKDKAVLAAEERHDSPESLALLYQWIALAYFQLTDMNNAAVYFETALNCNPDIEQLNYYAGVSFMSLEDYDTAISYFEKSMSLNEFVSVSGYNAAICCVQQENYEKAADLLQKSIDVSDDVEAVMEAESLLTQLKEFMEQSEKQ